MDNLASEIQALKELIKELEDKIGLESYEKIFEISFEAKLLSKLENLETKISNLEIDIENMVLFIKNFQHIFNVFADKMKSSKTF